MYNIVTIICVDESEADANMLYTNSNFTSDQRRIHYWQMAFTCLASSIRCNPDKNHLLYTNDIKDIVVQGIDLRKKLTELGVKIIHFPYTKFNPGNYAKWFKNATYKLSVCMDFANYDVPSIYIDSDCLWVRPNEDFDRLITQTPFLFVMDTYHRIATPERKAPRNMSMKDLGDLYKSIDPGYIVKYPILYGGEIVAGNPMIFKEIDEEMQILFDFLISEAKKDKYYIAETKLSMLDSDELINSFIYNKEKFRSRTFDIADLFAKRLATLPNYKDISRRDLQLTIWHLLYEKKAGLPMLFQEAINPNSDFWKISIYDFAKYLGEYVGIPKRKKFYSLKQRILFGIATIYRFLGSPTFVLKAYQKIKNY